MAQNEKVIKAARRAKRAVVDLARLGPEERNGALVAIAHKITESEAEILAANAADMDAARALLETGALSVAAYQRLKLDHAKVREMARGVDQVAILEDPLGQITLATELDHELTLHRVTCPIGVIGVIFESRPDALVQIASLCLKTGNAVLLKGGQEAEHSNRALFSVIHDAAVAAGLPGDALVLLESRADAAEMLQAEGSVDLIVPRGSNALVRYVQEHTHIPVLGHAEGICHVYVDADADLEKALAIVMDAKTGYPSACNAVETLLVHRDAVPRFLPGVVSALQAQGVEVRLEADAARGLRLDQVVEATQDDWSTEYCDLILSIRVVPSLDAAIEHINRYGSHHTDAIVTEDPAAWERFFAAVDSAGVYWNASTRFADGFRYGFGAEVGISTGKLHPRGPVGLEGLVTYKYKLVGTGQTAATYSGPNATTFLHRAIVEK